MLKSQAEVISLVMITGIIIGLVGTAYLWGAPLIEKRTTAIDVELAKSFINKLDSTITDIANRGSGEQTINIPIGVLTVIPNDTVDPDNNSVILDIIVGEQMLFPNTIVYLGATRDEVGIYGEAEPNIVTLSGGEVNNNLKVFLKSHYRELDTNQFPLRGFKIVLNNGLGQIQGTNQVTVSFDRIETIPNAADNGGDLIITHINVITF